MVDEEMSTERSTSFTKLLGTLPTPDIYQMNDVNDIFAYSDSIKKALINENNVFSQEQGVYYNDIFLYDGAESKMAVETDGVPNSGTVFPLSGIVVSLLFIY